MTVDAGLIRGWLAARSLARGLPPPVPDHGGWRVDSGQATERRRYVFAAPSEELRALGAAIDEPWVPIKLSGPEAALFALLPPRWALTEDTASKVMVRTAFRPDASEPPPGYRIASERVGDVVAARIVDEAGGLAASGYAAELDGVFIYDRIVTEPEHRRRGLGRVLMAELARARRSASSRETLTATPAGRALYLTLGWRVYSDWTTARIPAG